MKDCAAWLRGETFILLGMNRSLCQAGHFLPALNARRAGVSYPGPHPEEEKKIDCISLPAIIPYLASRDLRQPCTNPTEAMSAPPPATEGNGGRVKWGLNVCSLKSLNV